VLRRHGALRRRDRRDAQDNQGGRREDGAPHDPETVENWHKAADLGSADASAAETDTQIADDPASAPRDASPATLPFTGLQLALVLLAGLAAIAAGTVIRRAAGT